MRIMGLDYGTKTVGVAVSDPLGLTAQGIETIERKEENKLRRTCARIEELVREYHVDTIVLGFPKHMNNDIGDPTYITSYNGARSLVMKVERDELVEELLKSYIANNTWE